MSISVGKLPVFFCISVVWFMLASASFGQVTEYKNIPVKKTDAKTTSPVASEPPRSVGGFQLSISLEKPPSLFKIKQFEGMTIYRCDNESIVILVTLKNVTNHSLTYTYARPGMEFQADIRGGPLETEYGQSIPVEQILSKQAPLTKYGASLYIRSILPLHPPYSGPPLMSSYSISSREIAPGASVVSRIYVDFIYDLSTSTPGLYQISVRHLFPVRPSGEMTEKDKQRYRSGLPGYYAIPGVYEAAVSNSIDVRVSRAAFENL